MISATGRAPDNNQVLGLPWGDALGLTDVMCIEPRVGAVHDKLASLGLCKNRYKLGKKCHEFLLHTLYEGSRLSYIS